MSASRKPVGIWMREMSQVTGAGARAVNGWVKAGLLPRPGRGRGARYDEAFVARVAFIHRLREQGVPLAEIREQLDGLPANAFSKPSAAGGGVTVEGELVPVDTPGWERVELVPGLKLIFRNDGGRLVRRLAEEIVQQYGTARSRTLKPSSSPPANPTSVGEGTT